MNVGRRLADELIEQARGIGYSRMRLDTLPTMLAAIRLYESLGLSAVLPYYQTPLQDTVFMELRLDS